MQQTQETPLYAVVKILKHTIKSKWFVVDNGKAKEVTDEVFSDVLAHNNREETTLKIPFNYKDGFITYPFGCGLTHYFNGSMITKVTNSDVTSLRVIMTSDFTMYGYTKSETDWEAVMNAMIAEKGVE